MCLAFVLVEPPPCDAPADVAFIIDSSGSIGRGNYLKEEGVCQGDSQEFRRSTRPEPRSHGSVQ